jgi:hypothetical protein
MSHEDEMSIDERRKYLDKMQRRYREAGRAEKGVLLDEMRAVTGLHRKSLVRLMNMPLVRKKRCRQRGRVYGAEVEDALRVIAESHDGICAERLQPNLVRMAKHLASHGEMVLTEALLDHLGRISVSSVQRWLSRLRQDEPRRRRRKGPAKPSGLLHQVPMGRIPWDVGQPGHFEVDLVHHCGPNASGTYICSLQMIDVATGWSERAAVLGRGYVVMQDAFQYLLDRIPFPVLEVHPDNDSAFFNHHMFRFWGDRLCGARLSRSRPYHKNDNRFVEQGNASLVRAYLGHERRDTVAQTWAINYLYDRMWLYHNLFQPVMRLKEKRAVPHPDGSSYRTQRFYDQARTPLERVCAAGVLQPHVCVQLETLRAATNPRQLRYDIYDRLDYIFALPDAVPGQPENVYLTLRDPHLRQLVETKSTPSWKSAR